MTDQEIRLQFGEMNPGEMRLARALVAWHEREIAKIKDTLPERPQAQAGPWPGQQEAIDKAMIEASKVNGAHYALFAASPHRWPGNWLDEAPARLAIAQAYDAARPQAAEIAKLKEELAETIKERDRLAERVAVVLAQAVRRMESVPVEELSRIWRSESSTYHQDLHAVRARLLAAAKGEAKPVVVNEPPQDERQPDLSGGSESQTEEPAWIPHDGGPCPLKDEEVDEWQIEWNDGDFDTYKRLKPSEADGWKNGITHYRVLRWKPGFGPEAKAQPTTSPGWTPTVGDTVRLKSGGPAMTVTGVDPLSLMCAWMNASNELQVEPVTTLCLEPAKP